VPLGSHLAHLERGLANLLLRERNHKKREI
jgi:hypothetical protein